MTMAALQFLVMTLLLSIHGGFCFHSSSVWHASTLSRASYPNTFSKATSNVRTEFPSKISPSIAPSSSYQSTSLIQRTASETSFNFADLVTPKARSLQRTWKGLLESYPFLQAVKGYASSAQESISRLLLQAWWVFPMILAIVPVYCAVFEGTCASMPEWWPMVKMDYIRQSKDAALVIGGFLMSNIAYFMSGAFLLNRFPFRISTKGSLPKLKASTEFSFLGVWILMAGIVSTIFHSVQALGSYALAESLCYIDHAVALTAGFYYLQLCGFPSKKTLSVGITSLFTLVFTYPNYAFLHSAWHFLSAAAATLWAVEGYERFSSRNA